ncbi:MAG: hypothetical protein JXA68_05270, partial [Ignavibacteriales bacterium]|nr:hypothetical protein [Ignavibacteriales bacterium]
EDLTEKIFSLQKRKVIIFENFHKLFLRTVEGFEALHSFCELLSLVDEKLFLIISCNKFAWYYFDKVMNISDYFTHCVELEQLSKEKVKDIIFLRNNISGYPLKFLPTKEDLISRKFQKANEKERQDILCQNYFKKLNSIVKSNISLVQLFWLRSLELDENNTLQIKSLEEIDFSFLQTLSEIKYFTLMTFLQHNNLSVEEHSKIFHLTIDESKLILLALQDDGILINKGNQFEINFILYHHIIHLLQNKNIIH